MNDKIIGIVKCFGGYDRNNVIKNYGFIVSEINIGDIYFNKKNINNKEKILDRKDVVIFDLIEKNKKLLAINVTKLKDDKDFVNFINNDQELIKDIIKKLKDINKRYYFRNFYIKDAFDFLDIRTKVLIDEFAELLTDKEKLNYYIKIINSNEQDTVIKEKLKKYLLCKNLKTKYDLTTEFLFDLPRCILFDKDILNSLPNEMIIELSKKILTINSNQHIYNANELNIIREIFTNTVYEVANDLSLELLLSCIEINNNYIDVDRIIKTLDLDKKIIFISDFYQELDIKKQKIIDLFDVFNEEIDIDILPEDVYCEELLEKMSDDQKIDYIKKALNYYKDKDVNDFNVTEAKNILQETYKNSITLTINNMIMSDDENATCYKFSYFKKMIIEYVKIFNDKDFVNKNIHFLKNNLKTIKGFDNNDYNLLIYDLSQLNILDISLELSKKQIKYFQDIYKNKSSNMIDVFFQLSTKAQCTCLYWLTYFNKFDDLKIIFEEITKRDKKSILYIITYILLSRAYVYPESVDRLKTVQVLIDNYIDNINKEIVEDKRKNTDRPFNLSILTKVCPRTSKFCEAQCQITPEEKKIYCPQKRMYCATFNKYSGLHIEFSDSNIYRDDNIVWPSLECKSPHSNLNLAELLLLGNMFDDRVFKEAFIGEQRLVKENYVGKIHAMLNYGNDILEHLYCRKCGRLMRPNLNNTGVKRFYNEDKNPYYKIYAIKAATVYSCPNYSHEDTEHDHNVYLNACSGGCKEIIDSRDLNIRELATFYNATETQGYLLCKKCGSGDENFLSGSICPNCGSYHVKTENGKSYTCLDCDYQFRPMFSKKIYCPNCYERSGRNKYNSEIYNINSEDGIHFHCNNCNSDFVKKQEKDIYIKKCNDGKTQVLIPIFCKEYNQNIEENRQENKQPLTLMEKMLAKYGII